MPVSRVTRRPRSCLALRSSSPSRRTSSPRRGAGTLAIAGRRPRAAPIAWRCLLAARRCELGDRFAGDRRADAKSAALFERALAAEGAQDRARFRAHGWRCEMSCHDRPFATVTARHAGRGCAYRGGCSFWASGVAQQRRGCPLASPHASLAAVPQLHYHRVQRNTSSGKPALPTTSMRAIRSGTGVRTRPLRRRATRGRHARAGAPGPARLVVASSSGRQTMRRMQEQLADRAEPSEAASARSRGAR